MFSREGRLSAGNLPGTIRPKTTSELALESPFVVSSDSPCKIVILLSEICRLNIFRQILIEWDREPFVSRKLEAGGFSIFTLQILY